MQTQEKIKKDKKYASKFYHFLRSSLFDLVGFFNLQKIDLPQKRSTHLRQGYDPYNLLSLSMTWKLQFLCSSVIVLSRLNQQNFRKQLKLKIINGQTQTMTLNLFKNISIVRQKRNLLAQAHLYSLYFEKYIDLLGQIGIIQLKIIYIRFIFLLTLNQDIQKILIYMPEQTQNLRYGDLVRIHGVSINKHKMPQGLIIAKGFTDSNIYYQTYDQFDQVNFYRESLFQVLPKSNFDLHDQYLEQLANEKNKDSNQRNSQKARAAVQIENLFSELKSKAGKQVLYGAEVVFRHVESQEYLCGALKAADIGQGAFKLELRSDLSSQILFQIRSHRTYEHEGNNIYYNDCLQIYHKSSDCYVNFPPNTNDPAFLDKPQQKEQKSPGKKDEYFKYYQQRPKIKKPIGVRIPIINENKSKCLWKFIHHCSYSDYLSKEKIKSHDIVYFEHTSQKGLVASTLATNNYYLKEQKQKSSEGPSYECFWELVPKEVNQFGPQTCEFFWARNIVTGQILVYSREKNTRQTKVEIESKEKVEGGGFKSQGLINLICGEDAKLERGQPMNVDLNLSVIERFFEERILKYNFKEITHLPMDSFVIVKVGEQTIRDVAYVLSSHQFLVKFIQIISLKMQQLPPTKSDKDYGVMFSSLLKIQDFFKNVIHILKLLCGKIYATDYEDIESSGNTPIPQIQKILVQTGIPQLLTEIVYLLFEPFQQIQNYNQPSEDKAIRNRIVQIFEVSYRLLEKIANGYEDNRIYLSRWVDLFLSHSKKINKSFIQETLVCILQNNPVSIQHTIDEQKIQELIESFFAEARPIVDNHSEQFLTTKYLRLFSTFIKCEDRVLKQNQNIILNKFFNREDNNLGFKFKVEYTSNGEEENSEDPKAKEKSKKAKVSFGKDDYCQITEFFDNHRNKFNYLMSYINLLADVCMDRNNYAIESVELFLPLSVVSAVLVDDSIIELRGKLQEENRLSKDSGKGILFPQTNIHQPFIRIAHHAYVNNDKFSPIKRIKKINNWYKTYEQEGPIAEDINKTKRVYEGEKEEQEKQYLKYIRDYIKEFLQNCDQNVDNLQTLNTVLNLLKQTIILGLWDEIEDFRSMIPYLVMKILKIQPVVFFGKIEFQQRTILNKDQILASKDSLKLSKPQIALLIDCKTKATEIFKYINEMEMDIRLRYLMHFFQGLYDATENFEVYNLQEPSFEVSIDGNQEEKETIATRNETAREEFFKVFGSIILGDVKKVSQDQDIMLKQNIWLNKLKKMIPINFKKTQSSESPEVTTQLDLNQFDQPSGGNRNLFKYSQSFDTIILSLYELSGYQNVNLLNSTLTMLRVMFGQRRDLIQNFKQMLICGKGNLNEVYLTLKFMRNKFDILQNHSILSFDGNVNKSFPFAIWKPYDHLGRQESKRSGIIQDLFFLARTLKDNVSLKNIESLMHVQQEVFNEKIVYNFYNQRERNNSLFQELNMAEGIYIPLINYIKLVGKNTITFEIHRRLLFSIYQYLTLLCFNNMKAKHILMKYIPDVLLHLDKKVGAASFLYEVCINNKILVNNQELVKKIFDHALAACGEFGFQEQIGAIIWNVKPEYEVNINNDYEKSRILYSLRGVLLFGDEGHKKNQAMLMDKLQDSKHRRLIYTENISFSDKFYRFDLSPTEAYIVTHFELFSTLVESQNLINIGKLENTHSYGYCLECLRTTNRWQMRRALRSYVNRLYYINKDKDIFMFEEFIRKQFDIINKEFSDLTTLHRSKMLTEQLKIKNGVRFTYALSQIMLMIIQILVSLHEMFLKPEFIKLLKRQLAKQDRSGDKQNSTKKLHDSLIILLENLGRMHLLYPKTKPIAPFIRQIKRLLSPILQTFHVRYLQKKSEPDQAAQKKQQNNQQSEIVNKKGYSYDHSRSFFRNFCEMIRDNAAKEKIIKLKQQAEDRKNLVNMPENQIKLKYIDVIFSVSRENLKPLLDRKIKTVEELRYKAHLQTAHSKIFRVLAKPDLQQNTENIELNIRLNSVKQLMEDSPVFKKLKDDQFYNLVRIFRQMDDTSTSYYEKYWQKNESPCPIYDRKQIIRNIFTLIMNNPTQISDDEKIFVIKLVRCYISEAVEQNQNYKLSVDKWSADYYTDESSAEQDDANKSQLVRRQHEIEQCGGSDFIISIFKQNLSDRVQLLNEALLLGIIYLYNGNKRCQDSILRSLTADPDNLMLISVKNIINFIGNFLIQVRKMKDYEKVRNFAYKSVDSYDHFNTQQKTLTKQFGHNSSDKFQIQTQLNFQLALCRSFRFLQLFCQSNNTNMKNFLLTQTNEDGTRKTNSINFVSQTCLLTRKIFKIMNNKVVAIPSSVLDFINQITQIPCIETQLSLLRSTFFEDISYMAGFFESKQNLKQRKFNFVPVSDEDPLNQLKEIYEKGIGLAMSNFEGNDNQIVWEFLNKAQPKYLWAVIKNNLVIMLKQKAEQWKVNRQQIDKEIQNDSSLDKQTLREYRQFLVQDRYVKTLFSKFTESKIKKLIESEKSRGKTYRNQICNIINVISILKKIDDYAIARQIQALKDKENPNVIEGQKATKARNFRIDLMNYGQNEYKQFPVFMEIFEGLLIQIEVSSFNGREETFQNLYFPNHPVFSYLAEDTKDSIMLQVSRDTQRDKLTSLFGFYENIKEEIEQNYELNYWKMKILGKQVTIPITSAFLNRIRNAARGVSIIICITMLYLILVDHDTVEKTSYFTYYNLQDKLVMNVICGVQLMLTVMFSVLWLIMKSKISLSKYRRDAQAPEEGGQTTEQLEQDQDDSRDHWLAKLRTRLKPLHTIFNDYTQKLKDRFSSSLETIQSNRFYLATISPIINALTILIQTIIGLNRYESGFLSIIVFVSSSFLGNFVGVQWYTMHIFDFFVGISLLTNVFKAILDNIKLLGLLSGLAGCFILVFNIISLNTYVPVIYEEEVPAEACEDFLGCVLQLYTSGAIGDDMDQLYVGRFVFDTLYVVFMEMIFQGLVGGIIIDAFMGLKEEDANRDEDKKTKCYICAMLKPDMEKMGTTFNKHIEKHRLWYYIFYKYCLDMKDQTDYTGIEYMITEKIGSENVTWFPDNGEKDISGEIQQLVQKLKENIETMNSNSAALVEKGTQSVDKISTGIELAINKHNNELKQLRQKQPQAI